MEDYKKLYVVDSSVLIKWLINEEDSAPALKLKNDFLLEKVELITTTLCYYEILNFLGRNYPQQASLFFSALLGAGIHELQLTLEIGHRATKIMQKLPKVSFYDASCHAAAIEEGGTFLTADKDYHRKAKGLKSIKLIQDY